MTIWKMFTCLAAGLALGTAPATGLSYEDGRGRLKDDVRVKLSLRDRRSDSPLAKVRVRNQGRKEQSGVLVALRAGSEAGDILASWTVDLRPGRSWSVRLRVDLPEGTQALVATATLDGAADQRPDDNVSTVNLGPMDPPSAGASLFAAQCASCHGADASGTPSGPAIAGEDAEEVAEAVREGEDGMPTFPGLTAAEIRAIAAWLRDPVVVPPPPPPPPPPPGSAPTYAGNIKALLTANCTACHAGRNAFAGVRLDTLATASANADRALAAMEAGRMPQAGPLPAADIQLFRDWIAGGRLP
jgi:mono/diheme cytochrome c family protein